MRHTEFASSIARMLCIPGLLLSAAVTQALPTDADQPIRIDAGSFTLDEKTGIASYKGNVHLQQGSLEIRADNITIHSEQGNVKLITAMGKPAQFQQQVSADKPVISGAAEQIDYYAREERLQFQRNAQLKQESSSFRGNSIGYDMRKQKIEARGTAEQRVILELPAPPKHTTASTGSATGSSAGSANAGPSAGTTATVPAAAASTAPTRKNK